jgi:hypothetical protein
MPIILEGTLARMLANGGGTNAKGLYLTGLIDRMALWRHLADELSEVLKVLLITGKWLVRRGSSSGYGKAQNLALRLRAAYDQVLADVHLLLLPTLLSTAAVPPGRPRRGRSSSPRPWRPSSTRALFNLTGHPALSSLRRRRRLAGRHDAGRLSIRGEDHLSGSSGARTLARGADPRRTRRSGDVSREVLDSGAKRQAL